MLSLEQINNLPIRTIRVGGILRKIRYDEDSQTIFMLDDNGNFTGRTRKYELPPLEESPEVSPQIPAAEQESDENIPQIDTESAMAGADGGEEQETEEEQPTDGVKMLLRKWLPTIGLAAIVIIGVISFISAYRNRTPAPVATTPAPTTTADQGLHTTPTVTEPPITTPEYDTHILSAATTLMPGHKITAEDFVLVGVTYEQLSVLSSGNGLYTEDNMDSLVGLVIQDYIQQGAYLTYDDVGTVFAPANPWLSPSVGQTTVTLSVNLESGFGSAYLWGNIVDLKIVCRTKQETSSPIETTPSLPGVEHDSSVVESMLQDTYTFGTVQIVDILNADGNSLYADYRAWATVPAAILPSVIATNMADADAAAKELPACIVFAVTPQQAEIINGLTDKDMTVSVTEKGVVISSEYQEKVYSSLRDVSIALERRWDAILTAKEGQ